MRILLLIFIIVISLGACKKDEPQLNETSEIANRLIEGSNCSSFYRLIEGNKMEDIWSVKPTLDSGYIFCGLTETIAENGTDIFLLKSNCFGETEWIKTISNGYYDMGTDVIQTSTSEYLLASVQGINSISYQGQLIKTHSNGEQIWKNTYDFGYNTFLKKVLEIPDGGFVICGFDDSNGGFVFKTDATGTEIWRTELENNTKLYDITINSNLNYIACGSIRNNQQEDLFVLELNNLGDIVWSKSIDKSNLTNEGTSILTLVNDDICISGYNRFSGVDLFGFILKLNTIGDEIWYKSFENEEIGEIGNIVEAQNGDLIAAATVSGLLTLQKINSTNGSVVWKKDKAMNPLIRDMQLTDDNGLVLSGNLFISSGNRDGFILKTDSNGN